MAFDEIWKNNGEVKILQSQNKAQKTLKNKSKTNGYTRKGESELIGQQLNSIYLNLSPKCVNYGWWKSGLQKFRHLKSDQELEITDDYIQRELNERLETALVLSEN